MARASQTASMVALYRHGAYRDFAQEHRSGGTFGLTLVEADQKAVETVDPAVPEVTFFSSAGSSQRRETNFGDGWREHLTTHPFFDVLPSSTDCHYRLPDLRVRFAVAPVAPLRTALDGHGLDEETLYSVTERSLALPRAIAALDAMWTIAGRDDPGAGLALDGAFLTLLDEVIAAGGHVVPPSPRLSDRRLARAVDYAETHIEAALTVGELAAAAAMSPSAFSRAFRAATGETPWGYVGRRRLERAGERMARTDETLATIAAACGFTDASHLVRCWRRAHGTTPRGR